MTRLAFALGNVTLRYRAASTARERAPPPARASTPPATGSAASACPRAHVGVEAAYRGWRVVLLVAGLDVRILSIDGAPLRHLRLDPTVDYQPQP